MSATYALGIDLGTTNSAVSYYKNNEPQIIENKNGARVTPSYVSFDYSAELEESSVITSVGQYAKKRSDVGSGVVFDAKRFIGQTFQTIEQVRTFKYPFEIDLDTNNKAIFKITMQKKKVIEKTPEEISALILGELLSAAKDRLHDKFTPKAVITVPAYFTSSQRQATKTAAEIAGIEVLGLLNEPTAAAIHHIFHNSEEYADLQAPKMLFVYDLGGGTFDISIIQVNGPQEIVVKAIDGDTSLGGTDFDEKLMNKVIGEIKTQYNEDILESNANKVRRFLRRLRTTCTEIKETLSTKSDADIDVSTLVINEDDDDEDDPIIKITRKVFENENIELFEKTMKLTRKCLNQNKISQHQIGEVLLVGGSSRIPRIQTILEDFFGAGKIRKTVNPDEAVALGAAIYAASLYDKPNNLENFKLVDVLSFSLGTDVADDKMSFILRKNTSLPASQKKTYQTAYDNQTHFLIRIYEGEEINCEENKYLGEFMVDGLRAAPRGDVKLELGFNVDVDGILHVSAVEKSQNISKQLTITLKR